MVHGIPPPFPILELEPLDGVVSGEINSERPDRGERGERGDPGRASHELRLPAELRALDQRPPKRTARGWAPARTVRAGSRG